MRMPLCQKQKHFFTPPIFLELPLMIKHVTNNYIWNNFAVYYHQIQRNIHPNKQEINSKRVQGTNSD